MLSNIERVALEVLYHTLGNAIQTGIFPERPHTDWAEAILALRKENWFQKTGRRCCDWDVLSLYPAQWSDRLTELRQVLEGKTDDVE